MSPINNIIKNVFCDKKILIVGDLVADQFLRGNISRVSREAPVFILRHENTETVGGGAANAAVNVSALGGNAYLVGLTGTDSNGRDLLASLAIHDVNLDGVIKSDSFQTTTKLRVLAGQHYAMRQQVIRIDYENESEIGNDLLQQLETTAIGLLNGMDGVIISDYGYGAAGKELGQAIIQTAKSLSIPVLVDSRRRLQDFTGATAATPNQEEVEGLLGEEYSPERCRGLREKLGVDALLVTLGNKGMLLDSQNGEQEQISIVGKDEPVDVTGAGDTVIAAFALGIASGLGFSVSARIANHAGGIAVMKNGTASVTASELLESIQEYEPDLSSASLGQAK